jgi:glyoxylase-like metal-dependent hydrolase (beta-lactamase superfamily II)
MATVDRLADDLFIIDTQYRGQTRSIGAFLLLGERPALVETGAGTTVDNVLDGVRAVGLDPEALRAIAVTHIHLDHAGATGTLVRRYPHLEVYAHAIGAPHIIDPSKLVASARRLYGDALDTMLGEPEPVPAGRVHALGDGDEVVLGSRRLVAYDTPGHARHHLVFFDRASGDVFTGDAAGVALPGSRYVRPPTPPPELDVAVWDRTIDRLHALGARRLLLTHYGAHTWVNTLLTDLQDRLHAAVDLVTRALAEGATDDDVAARLRERVTADLRAADGDEAAARFEVIMSTPQSAVGLIRYVRKLHEAKGARA